MWAAEASFRLLDTTVTIRGNVLDAVERAARLLAPFAVERDASVSEGNRLGLVDCANTAIEGSGGALRAYRGTRWLGGGTSWARAMSALMTDLNRQAIAEYTGFAVHAGVVARDGRAVAFPADSGGGKSTLTAACVRAGFDYVSDEALCVDVGRGSVVAYPKPLGLSARSRAMLGIDGLALTFPTNEGEGLVVAEDLGGRVVQGALELAHVVLPMHGADRLALEPATGHEGMAALLGMSFNHYKHGERAFTLAAHLTNRADVWRLRYDDPIAAAELIRGELG